PALGDQRPRAAPLPGRAAPARQRRREHGLVVGAARSAGGPGPLRGRRSPGRRDPVRSHRPQGRAAADGAGRARPGALRAAEERIRPPLRPLDPRGPARLDGSDAPRSRCGPQRRSRAGGGRTPLARLPRRRPRHVLVARLGSLRPDPLVPPQQGLRVRTCQRSRSLTDPRAAWCSSTGGVVAEIAVDCAPSAASCMNSLHRYVLISPCRDEAAFMRRTLDSVAAQTVPPALWVVVDDGSTDETPRILEEYSRKLPYLKVVRRTDRGRRAVGPGVVDAFYQGLETLDLDDYDYLCKLDMDLDLPPRYFELLMRRMEREPRLGTCSGKPWFIHPSSGERVPEVCGD